MQSYYPSIHSKPLEPLLSENGLIEKDISAAIYRCSKCIAHYH